MNTNNNSTSRDDTQPKKSWAEMNATDSKPPKAGDDSNKNQRY